MDSNTARVYILDAPYHIDKLYDYLIPPSLRGRVVPGRFVYLPFGAGNRSQTGIVFETVYSEETDGLKPIHTLHEGAVNELSPEMLQLCEYIKDNTFCTFGEAVHTVLPAGALSFINDVYSAAPGEITKKLNAKALVVYGYIKIHKRVTFDALKKEFGQEVSRILSILCEEGILIREFVVADSAVSKYTEFVSLTDEAADYISGNKKLRGTKQKAVIDALSEFGRMSADDLKEKTGSTSVQIRSLAEKNIILIEKTDKYRTPYGKISSPPDSNLLSEEQKKACDTVCELCDSGEAKAALLRGVTGSGKTRVMKAIIDRVIAKGRSVIMLVPEISLTPQMISLFSSFYGEQIAVLHSSLSNGERFDEWRRMKEGKAKICIGTRSAIFAPFSDIGLVIIDEEQEHTYKSDMTPRYHARDIARWRCAKHKAVMLLSSATPCVESYYKAKSGIYTLVEMNDRYNGAKLPEAIICDMRGSEAPVSPIGDVLAAELDKNLKNNEQSILFINRRGYNNFVTCTLCGSTVKCPRCSVSLTYHTKGRYGGENASVQERRKYGFLICHWCGFKSQVPNICPECGSGKLQFMGYGTQMVEEELSKMYPGARVLRMDADTTGMKFSYDTMLEGFRKGEQDILLGTQMVTKGHDFPNVTLVGIVLADSSLYLDDYRAGERTFALIAQVIGRAGRSVKEGRAVIQTYNPDNKIFALAASQDYEEFYKNEIAFRHALTFPPFCDIALINISSLDEKELSSVSVSIAQRMKKMIESEYKDLPIVIFGPFEAPVYKVNERYRMRMVIKCRANKRTRELFRTIMIEFGKKASKKVTVSVDINPNNI